MSRVMNARAMLAMFVALGLHLSALLVTSGGNTAMAEEKQYKGTVLEQVDIGNVSAGERVMKMTLLEMEPGAEIPAHAHKGPGLRYVLEGAISIAWKDGSTRTIEAGSTYFEATGENHPAGEMSAKNVAEGKTRVIIVELLPKQ